METSSSSLIITEMMEESRRRERLVARSRGWYRDRSGLTVVGAELWCFIDQFTAVVVAITNRLQRNTLLTSATGTVKHCGRITIHCHSSNTTVTLSHLASSLASLLQLQTCQTRQKLKSHNHADDVTCSISPFP